MERKFNQEKGYWYFDVKRRKDAIRAFCLECMGAGRETENPAMPYQYVIDCPAILCPLYNFRQGKNPFSKIKGNVEALNKYRETQKAYYEK